MNTILIVVILSVGIVLLIIGLKGLLIKKHNTAQILIRVTADLEESSMNYHLRSKLHHYIHILPFISEMPRLIDKIAERYEISARFLVDHDYVSKEEMRSILEESIEDSIKALNGYLDQVKLGD